MGIIWKWIHEVNLKELKLFLDIISMARNLNISVGIGHRFLVSK